ncbi:MAG: carbohydrate ABC transporter permease [Candidatus Atribacteria bacterium]|nr:carbohydrate ABC transporter permease [Candidatus Atribacteria bacterium]
MNRRKRKVNILIYILAIVIVLISIFPIVWLFFTSFKPRVDIFAIPPIWLPKINFENYVNEFTGGSSRLPYLYNSIKVALFSTLVTVIVGSLAAYGIAKFPVPGKKNWEFWILSVRMMPPVAVVIPLYMIMRSIKLLDTNTGLILAHVGFNLPFAIWMLTGFFRQIPKDIEEAALIDGCNWYQAMLRISLPLSTPGLATISIFTFMFSWNELLAALVLTGRSGKTLPVAISEYWSNTQIRWEAMAAVSVVYVIPIIIVTFVIQRYIVRGLTLGAVKQ